MTGSARAVVVGIVALAVVLSTGVAWIVLRERRAPAAGDPFPIRRVLGAQRVVLTDLAGRERALAPQRADRLFELLTAATYEGDALPERETGGGVRGDLAFIFGDGRVRRVYLHTDFLWFEGGAYSLPAEAVDEIFRLFE